MHTNWLEQTLVYSKCLINVRYYHHLKGKKMFFIYSVRVLFLFCMLQKSFSFGLDNFCHVGVLNSDVNLSIFFMIWVFPCIRPYFSSRNHKVVPLYNIFKPF